MTDMNSPGLVAVDRAGLCLDAESVRSGRRNRTFQASQLTAFTLSDDPEQGEPFTCIRKRADPYCSFARSQELSGDWGFGNDERNGRALTRCVIVDETTDRLWLRRERLAFCSTCWR